MTPLEQAEEAFRRPTYDRWKLDEFWWLRGMLERLPDEVQIRVEVFDMGTALAMGFSLGDKRIAVRLVRAPVSEGWVRVGGYEEDDPGYEHHRKAIPGFHAGEISQKYAETWEANIRRALGLDP